MSASSLTSLLGVLHSGGTRPLHSAAEVDAVLKAGELLTTRYHTQLASSWEVAKLLSSVLRAQLHARSTAVHDASTLPPLSSLLQLFSLSWRMCPLVALPTPQVSTASRQCTSSYTADSAAALLSITDEQIRAVERELTSLSTSGATTLPSSPSSRASTADTSPLNVGTAVLLSLVVYWQALSVEGDSADEFQRVSATVWRCVHRWTSSTAVRTVFVQAWLSAVLRRALRCEEDALPTTVEWLSDLLSCPTSLREAAAAGPLTTADESLSKGWARLHVRVFQLVSQRLHNRQAALRAQWSTAVAPLLMRAFAQEPSLHSSAFWQAVPFADPLSSSLGVLVRVVAPAPREAAPAKQPSSASAAESETAEKGIGDLLLPLLHLASLQAGMGGTSLLLTPFATPATYERHVKPVVAVCLQWGLADTALQLLQWAEDGLDEHGVAWRQRLQSVAAVQDDSPTPSVMASREEEDHLPLAATSRSDDSCSLAGGGAYTQWLAGQLKAEKLSASWALTAVVGSHDVGELRRACDALLLCPSTSWATEVLRDPFAPRFLAGGLTRLVTALLNNGDAPLARFYVSLLGRLLSRCACRCALQDLLAVLSQLAMTLSAYHVSPTDYTAPTSPHASSIAAWRGIHAFLQNSGLAGCRSPARPPLLGSAMEARHRFYEDCHAIDAAQYSPSPPLKEWRDDESCVRCSAIEVRVVPSADEGGAASLELHCVRFQRAPRPEQSTCAEEISWPSSFTVRCVVGEAVRSCASSLMATLQDNRAQLRCGSAGGAAVETAMCADSRGPTELQSSLPLTQPQTVIDSGSGVEEDPTPPTAQQRKVAWWAARFALDARIGAVVASLQAAIGAQRMLLAGRPNAALCRQLDCIAQRFEAACESALSEDHTPSRSSLQTLRDATLHVLLGAPYLCASASATATDTTTAAQLTCWFCTQGSQTCRQCTATLRHARQTLLHAIVELAQSVVPPEHRSTVDRVAMVEVEMDWTSLLLSDSLAGAVEAMIADTLRAYCTACQPHLSSIGEGQQHEHADLLRLPREHVYLILSGELHSLPWEAIDVCHDRSVSRVPSTAFLRRALLLFSSSNSVVSLRRTLLYRDSDALLSNSALTSLIAQHPAWEVRYGETLQAATAAAAAAAAPPSLAPQHGETATAAMPALLQRVLGDAEHDGHLDTYVYSGHKGGEHLISRAALYDHIPRLVCGTSSSLPPSSHPPPAPLVMLMGCSSARMCGNGRYDSVGLPHAYLSAGAACVVGCLWDITDGDIDRLTCRLLQCAEEEEEEASEESRDTPVTVGECLAVARRCCKLRYLTAASTVLYGLNLSFGHPSAAAT